MGHFDDYLTRAFGENFPLKLTEVFGIFSALGERPEDFFQRHYQVPERELGGPEARPALPEREGSARLEDLLALLAGEATPLAPADWVARVARLLRELIVRCGTKQWAVSRALGLSAPALGQALRKEEGLTAWQLFGTLQVLGVGPGRFFSELFAPKAGEVAPGVSRAEAREALRRMVKGASPGAQGEGETAGPPEEASDDEGAGGAGEPPGEEPEDNGTEG